MRFLPRVDPQSLDLSVLKIVSPRDQVSSVPMALDRYPLLGDGMEILGRPVL